LFESALLLKERISPQNKLEVTHGTHTWTAKFEWASPKKEMVNESLNLTYQPLPEDYVEFLANVSNGCFLYYDSLFGQWGYRIYSYEELVKEQNRWKERFGRDWQNTFLAFAEMCGESHVLLFDRDQPSFDMNSFTIIEGNPIDTINNWTKVSRSFHEWLDHLITAQGDKYWEWK